MNEKFRILVSPPDAERQAEIDGPHWYDALVDLRDRISFWWYSVRRTLREK